MRAQHDEPPRDERPSSDEPDFADEHSDVTFSDELPEGPERAASDESVPAGLAGADPTET